jgi:hypothetical protein
MTNMSNNEPVTIQELLVSSLAQSDALAKLLIEKGRRKGDVPEIVESDPAVKRHTGHADLDRRVQFNPAGFLRWPKRR